MTPDPSPHIDRETATAIVRDHVDRGLGVVDIRPLHGGMINRVEQWFTDGEPASLVAKIAEESDHQDFRDEAAALAWYRRNTQFPVPAPYACVSDERYFRGTVLLMETLAGRHLGEARLSAEGMRRVQLQLAGHVADLHRHKQPTYGSALSNAPGFTSWLDRFGPMIERNLHRAAPRLDDRTRQIAERLIRELDGWLPEFGDPTLVHGDLWSANIMVDDADPDQPMITGFIDGTAEFCEVEYELAYLLVFQTAAETFFREYRRRHPIREGFDRRCRVYWLNTMLIHVWLFGDSYLPRCRRFAREIERLSS